MKNNLKQLRTEAGFSLHQLGELCRSSKTHIFHLEQDGSNPTLKTAYRIAVALDKTVTDIWPNDVKLITETVIIRRVGD